MTDTIKISRELAIDLLDQGRRTVTWAAQDKLRALLATPPADAADMGGQAGEEVEVVGYQWVQGSSELNGFEQSVRLTQKKPANVEARLGYQPVMTVPQHRRIVAQHRQQAGKLMEALRSCTRAKSAAEVGLIVNEAIAEWEKTNV